MSEDPHKALEGGLTKTPLHTIKMQLLVKNVRIARMFSVTDVSVGADSKSL